MGGKEESDRETKGHTNLKRGRGERLEVVATQMLTNDRTPKHLPLALHCRRE